MQTSRAAMIAGAALLVVAPAIAGSAPALADTVCPPGSDQCVVTGTVGTPAGPVMVTITPAHVVTVALAPANPRTLVLGLPFTFPEPPVAGCPGGCARTAIPTELGVVDVDTVVIPPGPPAFVSGIAVISFHPPSPCRVSATRTTVTFTPLSLTG